MLDVFFLTEHGRCVPDVRSLEVKDIGYEGIPPFFLFSSVTQSQHSYSWAKKELELL